MWNYIAAIMIGTPLAVFYVVCIFFIIGTKARFSKYKYETFGMLVNGLIGVVGFFFYMMNTAVIGETAPMQHLVDCPANKETCLRSRTLVIVYSFISSLRFLCWYTEFVISFVFIAYCLRYPVQMTLMRYTAHAFTVSASIITLTLVTLPNFPREELYGNELVTPVIVQIMILFYVLLSFISIRSSSLYQKWTNILAQYKGSFYTRQKKYVINTNS